MKRTQRFLYGLFACAVALATVVSASAQTRDEAAKVVRIKGDARYTTGGGVWQPLKVGDVLQPGSIVQTGLEEGSYVDVVIGDGAAAVMPAVPLRTAAAPSKGGAAQFQPASRQNAVRIFENTVLGFDKLTAMDTGAEVVTETQLDLKAGHILGNVRKLSPGSRYEIKLPNGVAGVRGTVFHLWADGRLDVLNGSVVSSTVDPKGTVQTRDVMGGQSFNPATDRVVPLPATTAQWMQSQVQSMTVVSFAPAPVTLDQTTYYVQPVISPTDGTPPNNGDGE